MKNTLLFVITLSSWLTGFGQAYIPLVKENKHWFYLQRYTIAEGCQILWVLGGSVHYFGQDTMIDNRIYKPLLEGTLLFDTKIVRPYAVTAKTVLCYMREDSIERKVYMKPFLNHSNPCSESQDEMLLFDFGLSVGDTINPCFAIQIGAGFLDTIPAKIDSIVLAKDFSGKTTRFLYTIGASRCIDPTPAVWYLVEGFGFYGGPDLGNFGRLLVDYCEGTLAECEIFSSTQDEKNIGFDQCTIFPNPVFDIVRIQTDFEIKTAEIIDQNGNVVLTSPGKEINVSTLPMGIYIIKCTTTKNKYFFDKMVKM